MDQILAEAYITLSNVCAVVDVICAQLTSVCTTVGEQGGDYQLVFQMGRAILRAAENALLMRVEADSVVDCHTIKMMLEGGLAEFVINKQDALLWIPATEEPFVTISACMASKDMIPTKERR